jgi:phage terminase large subunit
VSVKSQAESPKKPRGRPFLKGQAPKSPGRPRNEQSVTHLRNVVVGELLHDATFIRDYVRTFAEYARDKPGSWQAQKMASTLFGDDILDQIDKVLARKDREDTDFKSYRIWQRAHAQQRAFVWCHEREIQLMAGRRAGKTEGVALYFGETIVRKDRARCLYIGKTITKAMDLMWQPVVNLLEELGYKVAERSRVEGRLVLDNGAEIHFGGNSSTEEREKQRGFQWDVVAIDECQSQGQLAYLIEDVIYPTLIDRKGTLLLAGTGPRVRGTHWDYRWSDSNKFKAYRLNWSIAENPFIADYQTELTRIREEKGLSETSPLYVREYLGRIAYDDDALVLRLTEANYFTDDDLAAWIASQPVTDVRFEAGLDFGFEDADGFAIVCYSTDPKRPESWVVWEYKARRTGTDELCDAVRAGIQYVETSPLFARLESRKFQIYSDTGGGGKKTAYDLSLKGLPIQDAYKANKDMAVELLQDDCRRGHLKVRRDGALADECMKTVFLRNERDELTREVDDETYHPDLMDAVTYAMRPIWMFTRKRGVE